MGAPINPLWREELLLLLLLLFLLFAPICLRQVMNYVSDVFPQPLDFPLMSHRGPLRPSLPHPSRERPNAEVAEAGEEGGSCGSENSRIFGVVQQATIRIWIKAGHLCSYKRICRGTEMHNCMSDNRAEVCFGCLSFSNCPLYHGISTHLVAQELKLQGNGCF